MYIYIHIYLYIYTYKYAYIHIYILVDTARGALPSWSTRLVSAPASSSTLT